MKNPLRLLAVLLLISNMCWGQNIPTRIDAIIKDTYQKHPGIGISVGYVQNEEEYYTAYGKISKESEIDINKNSVFEIASITKLLTANLIAQAVLDQKLKLDDYIDAYLPKAYVLHENLKNKIRITDLASHQSGLTDLDFRMLIASDAQQPMSGVTPETLTNIINNTRELKDYGQYRYSTIGYVLLGQILETVYAQSYDEIIRELMLDPLQMTNTLTLDFDVKNRTAGYNPAGGTQEFMKWHSTAPAGLVKSSASDMITFLKAVLKNDTEISEAAKLTEKVYYKDGRREMGLGMHISTDDKNTIYVKTGDSMGQTCVICYNRVENWGIILLLNKRETKLKQDLFQQMYETILK